MGYFKTHNNIGSKEREKGELRKSRDGEWVIREIDQCSKCIMCGVLTGLLAHYHTRTRTHTHQLVSAQDFDVVEPCKQQIPVWSALDSVWDEVLQGKGTDLRISVA